MMIPVRCFTCGGIVGSAYEKFVERTGNGEDAKAVMDDLGITRYCCRRMIVAQVDVIDDSAPYA